MTRAQETAREHVCLLAEETAHPRFGWAMATGSIVLTINSGYE